MNTETIDVGAEAKRIFEEIKSYGKRLEEYGEPAEYNTYYRVSANLLERLLTIQERAAGLKQVEEFTETVLQIMQDELSPDQRTKVMGRLRKINEGGG